MKNKTKAELTPYVPALLLIGLLLATLVSWWYLSALEKDRVNLRFQTEADKLALQIGARINQYQLVLSQAAAAIELSEANISRTAWKNYIAHLDIANSMPGTQGVGFSQFVRPEELDEHTHKVRGEGFPDYRVHPAGKRPIYSSIVYLEPFDWRNQRAFGYDMYSEPVRREAMDLARDQNIVTISGRVTLVQETDTDVQQGFLMYAPVFDTTMSLKTLAERRSAILGYAYSVIRATDMLHGVFGGSHPDFVVTLYDQDDLHRRKVPLAGNIYHTDIEHHPPAHLEPLYSASRSLDLGGRQWELNLDSTPVYEQKNASSNAVMLLGGGMIISFLGFGLSYSLYGQGKRVEQRAQAINAELVKQTNRLKVAQQAASFGTWELNLSDNSLYWDELMFTIYGLDPGQFRPSYEFWKESVVKEDLTDVEFALRRSSETGEPFHAQFRLARGDGIRHIEARAVVLLSDSGVPAKIVGVNRDITFEVESKQKAQLAANVFASVREGILVTDTEQTIVEVNDTFLEITGYEREEVIGNQPSILKSGRESKDFYRNMWEEISNQGFWSGEISNRRKNGEIYFELLHISAILDEQGDIRNYVGVFSDITPLKRHERELHLMATHDALTGLPNRTYLHARIAEHLQELNLEEAKLGFLYLDLDHFKEVNDTYGHDVGDTYLADVSKRLRALIKHPNTVARIGGDEFVAICLYSDETDLHRIISNVSGAVAQPVNIPAVGNISLTVSIGVSVLPDDGVDPDTLLRQADQAMYEAKKRGGGGFVHFDLAHDLAVKEKMLLFAAIEKGLKCNEFSLYFQPKVDIACNRTTGFEGLIRWHHPVDGLIMPGEFIPQTEGQDISIALGEWVLRAAVDQLREFRAQGVPSTVSVNVSATHLSSPGFIDFLKSLQKEYGAELLSSLELEILESYPLQNLTDAVEIIERCKSLGVTFAIDDFGTGYSSLTYMKKLPADTLKIDQSFIRDMLDSDDDMMVVQSIIGISSIFHKVIVAEGVETVEQLDQLRSIGCQVAQGYYFAMPMPGRDAVTWLKERGSNPI